MDHAIADPYSDCESGRCTHDLARGVSLDELLDADGPHPASPLVVRLGANRPSLFDDMEEPMEVRRAS